MRQFYQVNNKYQRKMFKTIDLPKIGGVVCNDDDSADGSDDHFDDENKLGEVIFW